MKLNIVAVAVGLLFFVGTVFTGTASAASDEELQGCAAIVDLSSRLVCYDNLAKHPAASPAATATSTSAPASAAPADAAVTTEKPPEAAPRPKARKKKADSIQSRVAGDTTKLERGVELTLENGQVWKDVDFGSLDFDANSEVTIEKGIFGTFWLQVDGYDKHFSVQPIKLETP